MNQNQNELNSEKVEKKHNYFYKTTNLINGKYYYGIHSTDNLNDYYLGSGTILLNAIKKHGRKNFKKEIIADYPTRKEASDHEKLIVTTELVLDESCYNMRTGGNNEFTFVVTEETKQKLRAWAIGKRLGPENPFYGKTHTDEVKEKLRVVQLGNVHSAETREKIGISHRGEKHYCYGKTGAHHPRFGHRHTQEAIDRISNAKKGENNPSFGKTPSAEIKMKICVSNPNRNPCSILGNVYISVREASRKLEIPRNTIKRRLKSKHIKFKDWSYCE